MVVFYKTSLPTRPSGLVFFLLHLSAYDKKKNKTLLSQRMQAIKYSVTCTELCDGPKIELRKFRVDQMNCSKDIL